MAKIELIEQSKNFINKLTRRQKIIIGGIVGAVIISLVFVLSTLNQTEYSVLFSGLEENEAAKITEKLKEKNIDYKLEDNGTKILVEKGVTYDTRLTLANEGLPESGVVGYELFDKTNLGMSEFVQKLNYRRALEGELAKTIAAITNVKKAKVFIVIPEKALFDKDQKEPTASVYLQFKGQNTLNKASIDGIQKLVSSSVEGMQPSAVAVVDQRGKMLSESPIDENSVAGLTAKQFQEKTKVEQYLASKVQSMLDGVLGNGNAEVRVNADLDFTQIEKTITDFDPEKQVVRSEQNISENSNSSDSLSYPAVSMAKNQQNNISNYEISKSVERIVQGVGNIKRLTVSTLINGKTSVVEKNGKQSLQYKPRSDDEMQKLTLIVKNSIGFDPSRNDQVSVLNVPFDTSWEEEELKENQKPIWWQDPDNIKLFALIAIMLLTIVLMYRVLQSKYVKERLRIAFELPEHVAIEEEIEEEEAEEEEQTPLEDIILDEEQVLMLPTELSDQFMLEGEKATSDEFEEYEEEEGSTGIDKEALAAKARAKLDEGEFQSMSEETLLKLELKNKVQDYIQMQPIEAVKLVRMFMGQDLDDKAFKM